MKKPFNRLISVLFAMFMTMTFSIISFAGPEGVRYPLTPTVTPIRIFFAVLVIILFVVVEIGFEKIRNMRVDKRNEQNKKR